MASVFDVAEYILRRCGEMTTMKLQKLVYYSQAWALVWDEDPLFPEPMEAWANGPVVRALYEEHRGIFRVERIPRGNPARLTDTQRNTIDNVLKFYAERTSQWLSDLNIRRSPGAMPGKMSPLEILAMQSLATQLWPSITEACSS